MSRDADDAEWDALLSKSAGKLTRMAEKARQDVAAGRTLPIPAWLDMANVPAPVVARFERMQAYKAVRERAQVNISN